MPSILKSVRAIERPSVLRPGKSAAVTRVTEEPKKLSVLPGSVSLEVLKSGAAMLFGFLHGKPLMKMVCFPGGDVGQVSWRLSESAEQILVQKQTTERKIMQQEKYELILSTVFAVIYV
ncbi:hypothetical protein FF2_014809 [Malus domestica]